LHFRQNGTIKDLHNFIIEQEQYMPEFFVEHLKKKYGETLRLIDGGACYGVLLDSILKNKLNIQTYIAFEPDYENRKVLEKKLINMSLDSIILPLGIGVKEIDLKFKSGEGMASHFDKEGESFVKVINLDATIFQKIDLIKMDIEGFELEALQGAEYLIQKQRPALAISVYHKPNDIYDLPIFLAKYYDNFYIRQHGRYGFDMVLYCF